jgi:hypothetical protein
MGWRYWIPAMTDTVTVYRFKRYNLVTDRYDVSQYKATAEAVKRFGCEIIERSDEQVERSALDDLGRYKPKA